MSAPITATGFSLLENVVALAIVTAGLLGTTALFGEALRSVRDHHQRQTAILLGEELIDIAIALQADTLPGELSCSIVPEPCFGDAFAQAELDRWRQALLRTLPEASAQLGITGATIRTLQLSLTWPDSRNQTAVQRLERVVHR